MLSRTFRLFVSSTFNDFKKERALLQAEVFPELKEYCAKRGATFQPIDLRWGVNSEAQLDQKTLELCLSEIHTCNAHPRPNFLIMAGDRYGWVPLPYAIEKEEYETLTSHLKDTSLLNAWYELDTNHIPHSYIIKQRSGEFVDYDAWEKEEKALRALLQEGANHLPEDKRAKYFTSATQAEFEAGAMPHEDTFALLRHIPKESLQKGTFYEDQEDNNKALEFSKTIADALPKENALHVSPSPLNQEELNQAYLKEFKEKILSFLTSRIDEFLSSLSTTKLSPLEEEKAAHEKFLSDKLKGYMQTPELQQTQEDIKVYATTPTKAAPYILYGPSGSGKSALLAQVISELKNQSKLLYRFTGATPTASSTKGLWISMFDELGIELRNQAEQLANKDDDMSKFLASMQTQETFEQFSERLHNAILEIQEPVTFIIDAIDQIGHEDKLDWLPIRLPSHIKLIITALEDTNYQKDSSYLKRMREKGISVNPIPPFSNPSSLLQAILKEYNRSVTKAQEAYFLDQYQSAKTPLYITIAAQEMRHWKSHQTEYELKKSNRGIIQEFIDNLSKLYHHDKAFVKRTLSYLIATKGLSESELLTLLATDEAFIDKMAPEQFHQNTTKELPLVHWSRLQTQLNPFFKLSDDEGQEILGFFHREFQEAIPALPGYKEEFLKAIEDIFVLIQKNQTEDFNANRWGKLYPRVVSDYYLATKDIELLRSQASKLATIDEDWVESFLHYLFPIQLNEDKHNRPEGLTYAEILLATTKPLYKANKKRWAGGYASSLNNLAGSYRNYNRLNEAIALEEEALKIKRALYQANPQRWAEDYSRCLNNLAFSYQKAGQIDEAIGIQKEALATIKPLYGKNKDHLTTLYVIILNNLAFSYLKVGQIDKAIEFNEEALTTIKPFYCENPKEWADRWARILLGLAFSYKDSNRLNEAIVLEEEALEITRALYEANKERWAEHYNASLINLAFSYKNSNRLNEAIALEEEALKIKRALYQANPQRWAEDYSRVLNSLAASHRNSGHQNKAIVLFKESLEITRVLYRGDPERWSENCNVSLKNLADLYKNSNRLNEAIALEEESLEITSALYEKSPERWSEKYATSLNNLAILYQNINYLDKAVKLQKEQLEIMRALYSTSPERWAEEYTVSLNNLATSYYNSKCPTEAASLDEEALDIRRVLYQANPEGWAEHYTISLNNLAMSYYHQGKKEQALKMFKDAYEITKKHFGEEYSLTQEREENYLLVKRELEGSSGVSSSKSASSSQENGFNEPLTTLLYLAKGIAVHSNSDEITLSHLYNALHFVKLNQKAESIFRQIFKTHMDDLRVSDQGAAFIGLAKASPKIPYDEQVKELAKMLKSVFGDEPLCRLHE